MATIVIMPGGFHPFHAGHYALYRSAVEAFPDADVYVAATADTSTRPFPFPVKAKLAKLAGVPDNRFVQVKSPFRADEITARYNPEQDVLIFVRSEKDAGSPPRPGGTKKDGSPSYLQPWTGKKVEPFAKHAYMAYLPTVEFGPGIKSATEIRTAWPQLDDRRKTAFVMSLYPRTQGNAKLAANVVGLLDAAIVGDSVNEGWKDIVAGGALALGALGAGAQTMPDINAQQVELSNKYYNALVQRAKEDGRTLDTRALNFLKAKAQDAAAQKLQQSKSQPQPQNAFPSQGSEKRVAKDIGQFENQGWAATYEEVRASPSTAGAGMTAGYQRRENQPIAEKHQGDFDRDPELKQARLFAKQHYPEFSGDEELAYDKWVQRSIQHGREDDQKQFKMLQGVAEKIKRLENVISAIKQQKQQTNEDYIDEKWSEKYKRSINCSNPRGFSQRAHCAGRKK